MVTKDQAVKTGETWGPTEFHFGECTRKVGPRGGVTTTIVRVRTSGRCQTWKTRPAWFRLPVKHGLYQSGAITERNAGDFHLASECPLNGSSS